MKQKRNTLQKGIVLEVFRSMHNHPSAGMVYDAVHEKHPEISKATVYRLLAEWAEEGEIDRLKFSETDSRYDIRQDKHYHVVCRMCGAVADVDTDAFDCADTEAAKIYEDFLVEDFHVEFSGVCKNCRKDSSI